MAQHDYNLSNNTGALFRADLNTMAQAIATMNSGGAEPAVKFPGMLWLDLSGGGDGVVRRRNQANTAWLTDIGIDQTARDAAAAAQTTANAAVKRAGDTMTGPLNLPNTEPLNNNAVSRAQGDTLYQVKLPAPIAGSLLVGAAGGWQSKLDPGIAGSVLALSGGLPTWSVPATVATPNALVKTGADGFIDPSLIPSVASGLKYRGTFKPAVNAEYPTTGGSGAGGAPAVGDFWVIDALTTGGYTYLTGSLAGVTVYNGDSIAKSDPNWYKMGNTVNLQGYLKTDGSVAMSGNLDMGTHSVINIGGLVARTGTLVPFSGFSIDATNVVVSPQRGATGADLPAMAAGQLGTDIGRMQLFVGAAGSNTGLLAVRHFSTTAAYATGDYVVSGGAQYRAKAAVPAGAFTPSQWDQVMDARGGTIVGNWRFTAIQSLQWYSNGQIRFYVDHNDSTWVLCTCNDDGTFKGIPISVARSDGSVFMDRVTVTGYLGGVGQVMIGPDGNSKFRFTATGGYTYMDIVTSDNSAYAQWRSRCWGIAFTLSGGNMQVGGGNIETDRTVIGNAGGNGAYAAFGIGNDCTLWDVNRADTCQFRGGQNPARAIIEFGSAGDAGIGYENGALNFYNASYEAHWPKGGGNMYVCYTTSHIAHYKKAGAYSFYWRRTANGFPGGGGEFNLMEINDAGNLFVTGTVTAANIPGSDNRLKSNIQNINARALDSLQWHSFDFIDGPADQRGVIAQELLPLAPEHITEYALVVDEEWTTRYNVNYGTLALEVAMNARDRIIALEAAVAALSGVTPTQPREV